jgi:hypothetical protein
MRAFFLGIHQIARHIEFSTKLMVLLKNHMMLSLIKQMDLKMKMRNAIETMATGEIKPKEEDDDSVVVIPSSSTLNEETHQTQQNDEVEDDHVQNISSQSVPSQASTSNSQIASRIHHSVVKITR